MLSIIFICLGNICRSPLAEGYARNLLSNNKLDIKIKIDSAGLSRYHNGEPPCETSIKLASRNGIDISYIRSQHISEFDLAKYDLIIAMDESNKQELLNLGFNNVKKLGDFGFNGKNVADLYYESHKKKEVWEMITIGVEQAINILKNQYT